MLVRFDPWRELDRLTQDFWGGVRRLGLPVDVHRKGEDYVIKFDLPGVDPDSIDLTVSEGMLTVKAERHSQPQEGVEVVNSERPTGVYFRRLFLGDALDTDNLKANYDNGVLTVVVPITEAAKPKKIEVGTGSTPQAIEAGSEKV